MIKKVRHSYKGINQDITKSKVPNEFYFEGKNIRIIATNSQSTGSVTNEKGNTLIVAIPIPFINFEDSQIEYVSGETLKVLPFTTTEINETYPSSGEQIIIGHGYARNNFVLFTTDNNGIDCIWKIDEVTYDITLLYLRNLNFGTSNPIQVINNYENDSIDKIYWVDGKAQTRYINIHHSILNQDLEELIDLSSNNIQIVGKFDMDQPEIIDVVQGGIHTSGMIQYAYNLYRINGSQTTISPLTELIALTKGESNGGGDVNEIVGAVPVIKIDNLDETYTNLKLYAIKYTSYNETPSISIILDKSISGTDEITYYDDGNIISSLSLEEFLFLGSNIIIPKHINTKKNIMFFANYKEKNFDVDTYNNINSIDTRAYSFAPNTTSTNIYESLYDNAGVVDSLDPALVISTDEIDGDTTVPYKHPAINKDYDTYNRQYNSNVVGGEGAYIRYRIVRNQVGSFGFTSEDAEGKFLKDNEVYRLGIQFYNSYGQISLPKWITDFKNIIVSNNSNLRGFYSSVQIGLKPLFYVWLNTSSNFLDENGAYDESLKPVGYKLLRAERTLLDRTILCQGLINGMLSQVIGDTTGDNEEDPLEQDYIDRVNGGLKIPSMMRRFDEYLSPMWGNKSYFRVDRYDEYHPNFDPSVGNGDAANEVFKDADSGQWTAGTYQFTKLMQMFSPEITFNTIQNLSQTQLNVVGGLENDYNACWAQSRNINTKLVRDEVKTFNAISHFDIKAALPGNRQVIKGDFEDIQEHGFFGHFESEEGMNFAQTYRRYTGDFYPANVEQSIYGVPEISTTGQSRRTYNGDGDMIYYNSLENLSADSHLNFVNSWGARNAVFALGANGVDTQDRIGLEDLYALTPMADDGQSLVGEFRIPKLLVYLGNIYGGNSYESKKRSNYLEVGEYQTIATDVYNCLHFGDTFISAFKFAKIVKTNSEVYSYNSEQVTEIVEFRVETTVDLKNRNDESLNSWDNRFQPQEEEYTKYNKVYSQEPTLIIRRDLDYRFKRVNSYDTNIISSKVKLPGEIIDSWTDLQPNNTLTLNGRYGPINALISFRDELYTLQDSSVAFISIMPRVQISGSDGLEVELGSGKVLQEYRYISTESGTKNKWSVVISPSAFYYFDSLNKSINIFKEGIGSLSDSRGLHTYFMNNTFESSLNVDNPVLGQGVSSGYDFINNDMFMTFLQGESSFTLSYNETLNNFVSFYDYIPARYISKGNNFITTSPSNTLLYRQYYGEFNTFYGVYYPSYIIFLVNPESEDCTLNNIEYRSEVYLDNLDQPSLTLTHVQLWNEYQDSELRDLVINNNLSRKFRTWRITLPRNKNTRDRIRNPWNFVKLQFENEENKRLILHDVDISYTV